MGNVIHRTVPVLVWADIDEGIADFVRHLNTLPGVRTHYCCQGTIGEGGHEPYEAYVGVSWHDDTAKALLTEFSLEQHGNSHGNVHPPIRAQEATHDR